jgi:hypothetical protein
VKVLAVIGWPLVGIAVWIEVYALVIQLATDSCSFGYCALGHGTVGAAPHLAAAVVATLAVVLLAGMIVLDRRLGRRLSAGQSAGAGESLTTARLMLALGILVGFGVLSLLTWGQPFGWIAEPPPCVPPAPEMNLYCDTATDAELFHLYGGSALLIATGAGVLAAGAGFGVRRIVSQLRLSPA